MFGMLPKRKPLFQMPGAQMPQEGPVSASAPQMAPEPKKGGFFAPGGTGRAIAGTVGDFLLQYNDMDPIYQPQMQYQQVMAERQRQASLEREQGWQDWIAKETWKRDNPTPQRDDTFTRTLEAAGIDPASEQGRALYRQRAETLANPVQWITGADGVPRPFQRSVGAAPPDVLPPDFDFGETSGSNAAPTFRP